ncbi:hypothetical protein BG910_06120 [Neisseria chenwenguii]|uniref:Uncharacterized protein n=2 Tax=Neisseria chenwenguii TaxID=1853278 RepID=A0A220S1K9_9NEIS|nr:DUF3841 domain-containing protein [Neisseria chenwenguii]ASK27371.1 hypothetical protein BG910_06120 [Neisseria chenwenguii]ROV56957.1 DUF3841 domain-containing protein [Neisseria chenwenguii]
MPERLAAYRWMAARLAEKVPPPASVAFPIWAWRFAHGRRQPKPDLRRRGHLEKGAAGVRIEFEIPQEQVLLSSFDGWHAVLNDTFFSLGDEEYERCERLEAELPSEKLREAKEKSWYGIFDLSKLPGPDVYEVQAVFWRLDMTMVGKVDFLRQG